MFGIYKKQRHYILALVSFGLYALAICLAALNWDNLLFGGVMMTAQDRLRPIGDIAVLDGLFKTQLVGDYVAFWVLCVFSYGVYQFLPRLDADAKTLRCLARRYRQGILGGLCALAITVFCRLFAISPYASAAARTASHTVLIALLLAAMVFAVVKMLLFVSLALKTRTFKQDYLLPVLYGALFVLVVLFVPGYVVVTGSLVTPVGNGLPGYFLIMNGYDMGLSFIPLMGALLMAVNLKYNAPLACGVPIVEKGMPFKTQYTLITHRSREGVAEDA